MDTTAARGVTRRAFGKTAGAALAGSGGALWLAACGAGGVADSSTSATGKGPVTIRLATDWLSGARGETMKMAVPAFEQKYPNVKVEVEAITGDYYTAVNTQLAAGTIQDIALFEGNFFQSFKDQGAFAPLDAVLKQLKVSMTDYTVVPGVYQDKGKQYGMPFQLVSSGWFYNEDLFKARGLKLPDDTWTWDDVVKNAQALTQPDKQQFGILITNSSQFCWGPLLFSSGTRWFNADKTRTTLADPGGLEAFQWVIDLIHRHHVAPTPDEQKVIKGDFGNGFLNGKVAMFPTGMQGIGNYVTNIKDRFKWGVMPTPKHPKTKKATQLFNDQPHMVMSSAQKHGVLQEVVTLAIFLAGEVVQGRIAVDRGSIPVLKKLQTSGDYLKPPPENVQQVARNLADPDIQTPGYIKGWDEWWKAVNDVDAAFAGTAPAQQVLRNAAAAGDVALTRAGPQK